MNKHQQTDELDALLRSDPPILKDQGFSARTVRAIARAERFRLSVLLAAWAIGLLLASLPALLIRDWAFVREPAHGLVGVMEQLIAGNGLYLALALGAGLVSIISIHILSES